MRFRFCGDLDCPDWVLAEISTLARLTSVKIKLLCAQVLKDLLGTPIDYEKVNKLTADAKYEPGDVKASIAALHFILCSAGKYGVDGEALSNELQQLGLPKEHSTAICRSYADNLSQLQLQLSQQGFKLSQLESVKWRVDYIVSSSHLEKVDEPSVQLKLDVRNPDTGDLEPVAFTLSQDKFRLILSELKQAQSLMAGLS